MTNETSKPTFNDLGQLVVKYPPREQILRELEQRSARPIHQPEELTVDDFQTMLSELTTELDDTVETYQENEGKPNLPLIQARDRLAKLTAELHEARQVLATEEQKGSLLDRLRAGVYRVEGSLQALVGRFGDLVGKQMIVNRLGHLPPKQRVPAELKAETRSHLRVVGLRKYNPVRSASENDVEGADALIQRARNVADKIDGLRAHIDADQSEYAKS